MRVSIITIRGKDTKIVAPLTNRLHVSVVFARQQTKRRGAQQCVLHCPRCDRAGACVFLFRGRAWSALGGQAADQGIKRGGRQMLHCYDGLLRVS